MAKSIRIAAAGWENFTGDFAGIMFEDGCSVEPVPQILLDRIGAIVEIRVLNEDGEDEGQGGAAARIVGAVRQIGAEVESGLAKQTDEDRAAEKRRDMADAKKLPVSKIYTLEELITVGEKGGISALREIAKPWNVHDRKIKGMIQQIMKAQNEFEARVAEAEEETRKLREAADAAALAKQQEAQEAFEAGVRLVKEAQEAESEGISNAIDESGANTTSEQKPAVVEIDALETKLNGDKNVVVEGETDPK